MTLPMQPLQHSFAADELEQDLKDLFIQLYDDTLREQADEINVYGAPHIGPFSLVERHVTQDGLAMLRQGDETGMRYLFKAWRFRNPMRGTHFLHTYLQVLFGDVFEVDQMWQAKADAYPTNLKTENEITWAAEDIADYYLTSRIRVDLDTDLVPDRVIRSLRTAIAARFVINMRIAKFFETEWQTAIVAGGSVNFIGSGESVAPRSLLESELQTAMTAGGAVILFANGQTVGSMADSFFYNGTFMYDGSQNYDGKLAG